jgi:hypothetical protein
VYITSPSFLELLNSFKILYAKCKDKIEASAMGYHNGLDKLASASKQVKCSNEAAGYTFNVDLYC